MKRAFTLIELLVVIAIIAILAAILFPVFAQAKVAAKKSVSVSNAKQMGLAQFMYMGDNDDTFVSSWAKGFPGDASFWVQPYMKNLDILFDPNKTVSTGSLATVCGESSGDPYGGYQMDPSKPNQRDNPTQEQKVWGYGINKGASWMDGSGVQVSAPDPMNKGQVIQTSLNGKTVDVTVWSVHQGISATAVVAPADTFFFANSGELPRMSMQIEAMTPVGYPGGPNSACFNAAHANMPYAGGNTYLFCDGHVKWETYVKTPVGSKPGHPSSDLGGSLPQVSKNPCRYDTRHDPSENFQGCQTGWN